jgi:hypothetical protein
MKKYLLYPFLLFSITFSAQPIIEWQKSIGGSAHDSARNIIQTTDGGYVLSLITNSNDGDISGNHGSSDIAVLKMSAAGTIEWQKSYGGTNGDSINKIRQTSDGGYILIGSSSSNDGDATVNHGFSDYWVVKLTSLGVIEWQKSFGGSNYDSGEDIRQTLDGGYIVAGTSSSNNGDVSGNHGYSDYWIIKLTNTGTISWQKSFGSTSSEAAWAIIQTSDGGYLVNGDTQGNNGDVTGFHGEFDYWVVKLTSIGVIEWQKSLGGTSWDTGTSIIQDNAGNYIVVGYSSSNNGNITNTHGGGDGWVIKLDTAGNILWDKGFGGTGSDFIFNVQLAPDGSYLFCGDSTSNNGQASNNHGGNSGGLDYWVVKSTTSGDFVWGKLLGGTGEDTSVCVIPTLDGGYMVSGYTDSTNGDITATHGQREGWIVKLYSELTIDDTELEKSIRLYPNPSNTVLNINSKEIIQNIKAVDVLGKQVYNNKQVNEFQAAVDVSNWAKGIYIITVETTSTTIRTLRFIKS